MTLMKLGQNELRVVLKRSSVSCCVPVPQECSALCKATDYDYRLIIADTTNE